MRFVDDGRDLLHRHLVLIDQLDDVDAGVRQLADLRARVVGAVDAPAERFGARIRLVLDERTRDVDGRALRACPC